MIRMTARSCIVCKRPTTGSVGAAGIRWPMICQTCKDREDQALAERVAYEARAIGMVTELS